MAFEFSLYGERFTFSIDDKGAIVVGGVDDSAEQWEAMAEAYCNALDMSAEYMPSAQWVDAAYAKALGASPPAIDTSHDPEDAIF